MHTAPKRFAALLTFICLLAIATPAFAEELSLGTNSVVSFATVEMAGSVLTNRDDFIRALSLFDRAARMKVDREVTEAEFLEFAGRAALPWSAEETNRLTRVLQTLQPRLAAWNLPLPPTLMLIKTSGAEEGNANYTRGAAIILTGKELSRSEDALEEIITHELFHVISRNDPELRKRLYRIVGFHPISELVLPEELRARKITNPDGVQNGWVITVTNRGRAFSTVPILYASADRYDSNKGGEFFNYLVFKLLAVTNGPGGWQPLLTEQKPALLDPREAGGYFEQIGRNTTYIIHPDEILAMNFIELIGGNTNVATPRILSEMKAVLQRR